jgi:hypothetical protein
VLDSRLGARRSNNGEGRGKEAESNRIQIPNLKFQTMATAKVWEREITALKREDWAQ